MPQKEFVLQYQQRACPECPHFFQELLQQKLHQNDNSHFQVLHLFLILRDYSWCKRLLCFLYHLVFQTFYVDTLFTVDLPRICGPPFPILIICIGSPLPQFPIGLTVKSFPRASMESTNSGELPITITSLNSSPSSPFSIFCAYWQEMLQLYRIMSIEGIFMLQIKNPFFTSFIISSGFQFPGAMQVHAILTRGINEYPVARMDEFGTVSKMEAVSRLCIWLLKIPSSTSTFFVAGTPSSSYLYHPRLEGIVGSSITLSSEEPIFVPSFPAHHAPPAHAISFPSTRSASDGCPSIS